MTTDLLPSQQSFNTPDPTPNGALTPIVAILSGRLDEPGLGAVMGFRFLLSMLAGGPTLALTKYALLLPPALAMGWFGTRTARHIRHTTGGRGDELTMLVLGWSPLAIGVLALLLALFGSNP